jgi:hypothetical protein
MSSLLRASLGLLTNIKLKPIYPLRDCVKTLRDDEYSLHHFIFFVPSLAIKRVCGGAERTLLFPLYVSSQFFHSTLEWPKGCLCLLLLLCACVCVFTHTPTYIHTYIHAHHLVTSRQREFQIIKLFINRKLDFDLYGP